MGIPSDFKCILYYSYMDPLGDIKVQECWVYKAGILDEIAKTPQAVGKALVIYHPTTPEDIGSRLKVWALSIKDSAF